MTYKLGKRSLANLGGVHPRLITIVKRALEISLCDFSVVDGRRTIEHQRHLFSEGKTWTMNSYHLPRAFNDTPGLVAAAVDIYPWVEGETSHKDQHYAHLARAMFQAAQEEGLKKEGCGNILEWGGFWTKHTDKPHWQYIKV